MDADYDIFEIVSVFRDFWLIDAESYQRRYCTHHGQPLVPGYYVVNWPEHIRSRRFTDEHVRFHGPFKLRQEAQAARDWMHKKRSRVLTMSFERSSVATLNSSLMDFKKAASQGLRPAEGTKEKKTVYRRKPWKTSFPPADYRETIKATGR